MQNYLQKYGFYCAIDMNAYGVYGNVSANKFESELQQIKFNQS